MSSIYNSPLEMELRVVLVLGSTKTVEMTLDRIVFYDFIVTHGMYFSVSSKDLHGTNNYGFGELTSRRTLIMRGLKDAVLHGIIAISKTDRGYLYSVTESGMLLFDSIIDDYKREYVEIMKVIEKKYYDRSDVELLQVILEMAKSALRR